jgi:predicted MFS family arabinose efflux permease
VPRPLWERANAVDSGGYVVAAIAGPAVAGLLIGVVGAQGALLATASLYVAGLLLLVGMTEPIIEHLATASLARDALAGLRYVLRHRELRGLAVATAVSNIAFGIISVGMPVFLLTHLHVGDGSVGAMYAVMGVAGLVSGTIAGRMNSERREVWFVVAGCAGSALSMLTMLAAASLGGGLVVVALAMTLFGLANGPFDIGLFSLRQRVTAPAWMGRAFAVSMSLNFIGMPIGSAVGGPIVEHSVPAAFALAVAVDVIAGLAAILMLRPRAASPGGTADSAPSGSRSSPLAAE